MIDMGYPCCFKFMLVGNYSVRLFELLVLQDLSVSSKPNYLQYVVSVYCAVLGVDLQDNNTDFCDLCMCVISFKSLSLLPAGGAQF